VRGADEVELSLALWRALQVFAKQAGWRPAGAVGTNRRKHSVYRPGLIVRALDARQFAAALVRFVNGDQPDVDELDLAAVAAIINFARRGAFEIRKASS
jgi:hypothetical protein